MSLQQFQNFIKNGRTIVGAGMNYKFHTVGKTIFGAGLNYKSLLPKGTQKSGEPVIFIKPVTSYIIEGQNIEIPRQFTSVIHEIELGVVIGTSCSKVSPKDAMNYVAGYCLALDMTATCHLGESRSKGLPWTVSKGFDTSCPVSKFIPASELTDPHNTRIWCKVNGKMRQDCSTCDLLFTIPELISYISQYMTLSPCDLILSGTPPGVAPVVSGDVIESGIADFMSMKFKVK